MSDKWEPTKLVSEAQSLLDECVRLRAERDEAYASLTACSEAGIQVTRQKIVYRNRALALLHRTRAQRIGNRVTLRVMGQLRADDAKAYWNRLDAAEARAASLEAERDAAHAAGYASARADASQACRERAAQCQSVLDAPLADGITKAQARYCVSAVTFCAATIEQLAPAAAPGDETETK